MHWRVFHEFIDYYAPLAPALLALLAWLAIAALAACGDGVLFLGAPDNNDAALGRVSAANSVLPANTFSAVLLGTQEVPPAASSASGMATLLFNPNTLAFRASIVTARLAGNAAHIHLGAPGAAGPIVFPMSETAAGSGIWTVTGTFTAQQLVDLQAGQYYVDVHSAAFPDGEIRGQLLRQLPVSGNSASGDALSFFNVLTGTQEVPPTGSVAKGIAITVFDPASAILAEAVTTLDLSGSAAHIHQAGAGFSGPIVFPLAETAGGSGIWATATVLTALQSSILSSGNFYMDIHSASFPNGEIRGQIVASPGAGTGAGTGVTGGASGSPIGTGGLGTGTGSASIGTATGSSSIDTGTGSASVGTGTGSTSIDTGTGSASVGTGTGSASIATSTGSASVGTGTGSASIDTGTGSASIDTGTGSASVGTGSGVVGLGTPPSTGSITGVAAMTTGAL